jgi:hypothetical protein
MDKTPPHQRHSRLQIAVQCLITLIVIGMIFAFKVAGSGAPQAWSIDPHNEIVVGRTPLMNAILAGQTAQAGSLLKQNPYQVNMQDSLGWTPLL